jgi:hypothetical protein
MQAPEHGRPESNGRFISNVHNSPFLFAFQNNWQDSYYWHQNEFLGFEAGRDFINFVSAK